LKQLSAALVLACTTAIAADPESVAAPYIEVGDCWSYQAKGMENRGPIDAYELCVANVEDGRKVIQAVATVKGDGREIDAVYTAQWGDSRSVLGTIATPAAEFLRFPLRKGNQYRVAYDYRGTTTAYTQGRVVVDVEVVGWEDVAVPAGRFRAMKVVAEGRAFVAGQRDTPFKRTWWYVPGVHRHVKYTLESDPAFFGNSEELTGYRLNK
jgi:hypothetical protein